MFTLAKLPVLLVAAAFALNTAGCLRPPSPAEQVTEAARELNLATRFGRMDVASERASDAARKTFLERRQLWGNELRVVDIDLSGLNLPDQDHAEVMVNVSWMRMSEGLLRNTVVVQHWTNEEFGWQLTREKRVAGDLGLFGENVEAPQQEPSSDVHYPSRTIR